MTPTPHVNGPDTRSSLLEKVRNPEDAAAWERFFDLYAPFIRNLADSSGLRSADIDDLTQSLMIELVEKLPTFTYDRTKGRFRAWLKTAAKRRIIDALRARSRRAEREILPRDGSVSGHIPGQLDLQDDAFDAMADAEWLNLLRTKALDALRREISLHRFQLFHAYVIEEKSIPEIQQLYGTTDGAIYQAKAYLLPRYQAHLARITEELETPRLPAP